MRSLKVCVDPGNCFEGNVGRFMNKVCDRPC